MKQQAPSAPSQPPTAPPAPATAPVQGVPGIFQSRPLTRQEREAIRDRRSELSDQLQSAAGRRERLVQEMEGREGAARAGLEARVAVLDDRIVQIERDIAETGRILTDAALPQTSTADPFLFSPVSARRDDIALYGMIGGLVLLLPLVIAFARRWSRGGAPARDTQQDQRLERIEHAVDAIAIEVERISESQRYSAKLLTEGVQPAVALAAREREPTRMQEQD